MGLMDGVDWPDCARNAFAGGFIGTVCGFMFGTADAGKSAGLTTDFSKVGSKLRDPTLMRFFFKNQMQTTLMFGGFYTLYQTSRCLIENHTEIDKYAGMAGATVVSLAPVLPSRLFRRNLPWALCLVGMDAYSGGLQR
mmetsp:Transcript_3256/g.5454  ORF Transcript_3256/g.5454 Transcript_3256/m.5454 type:complete len:138 (+) Transcript_3256:102-515(+)|eukprot:CAMPEP_0184515216 /NCGR_PEP_ID=MMETSP0198_2-20121128/4379_1 /TAXON_ID=1112570 /ORGANISM="Thraustochytrium sp., Strain LLF1b" /LENGTH=137 /DNA_ID=CAMNT_0026905459 /DNA_START=238 /DNA_END=651 /DNA_ORIENTATION=-